MSVYLSGEKGETCTLLESCILYSFVVLNLFAPFCTIGVDLAQVGRRCLDSLQGRVMIDRQLYHISKRNLITSGEKMKYLRVKKLAKLLGLGKASFVLEM